MLHQIFSWIRWCVSTLGTWTLLLQRHAVVKSVKCRLASSYNGFKVILSSLQNSLVFFFIKYIHPVLVLVPFVHRFLRFLWLFWWFYILWIMISLLFWLQFYSEYLWYHELFAHSLSGGSLLDLAIFLTCELYLLGDTSPGVFVETSLNFFSVLCVHFADLKFYVITFSLKPTFSVSKFDLLSSYYFQVKIKFKWSVDHQILFSPTWYTSPTHFWHWGHS